MAPKPNGRPRRLTPGGRHLQVYLEPGTRDRLIAISRSRGYLSANGRPNYSEAIRALIDGAYYKT